MKSNYSKHNKERVLKYFSFFIFLFSFAFASCSKSDEMPTTVQSGDQLITFQVEAPTTRATVSDLSRYIVEAYEGENLTITPVRAESGMGTLTLILRKDTDYTLLFWADKGVAKSENVVSSGYWNTDDLKAVTVADAKRNEVGEVAYCHKLNINSGDLTPNYPIPLKNATTQVNFIEAAGLVTDSNSLKVTYKNVTLNMGTGKVEEKGGENIHTFANIGQLAINHTLALDYVLAPLGEKNVTSIKVQFNNEPVISVSNVPFQQSYKTNIKGEYSNFYSTIFNISQEVDDYNDNPDVVFPEVLP